MARNIRDAVIAFVVLFAILALGAVPTPAQECVPYNLAVQRLVDKGWIIHPDVPMVGFDVVRLLIASLDGHGQ